MSEPGGPDSVTANAGWLAIATVAARLCTFALSIAMGRHLGVSAYGRYGFAVALGTLIVPVADLGMTSYVYREVARDLRAGGHQAIRLGTVKWQTSALALMVTAAVAFLVAGSKVQAATVTVLVIGSMIADGISSFAFGYFQGREQMRFQARLTLASALARSVGGLVWVYASRSLTAVVSWMLVVSVAQLALSSGRFRSAVAPLRRAEPRAAAVPIAWRSVLTMGLLVVFTLIYARADSVMIGVIRNHRAVGVYTAAYTIMGALELVPLQVVQAVAPVFARIYGRERARFEATWHESIRVVLVLSLPLALAATLLAGPLLQLPYGSRFAGGTTALAILVWFAPLSLVNMLVAAVLYAAGREFWPMVAAGIGTAVNLGANLWAIPRYGIAGAAAVTVATELAVLAVQLGFMVASELVPVPRGPWVRMLGSLAALSAVAVALRREPVLVGLVGGLAAYAAAILTSRAVAPRELVELASSLTSRVRR